MLRKGALNIMSTPSSSREKIIELLIIYLPELAVSIGNIGEQLKDFLNLSNVTDPEAMKGIVHGFTTTLANTNKILDGLQIIKFDKDSVELSRELLDGLGMLNSGANIFVEWFKDEDKPQEGLTTALSLLTESSKLITNVVDKIVSEGE